MLKAELGSIKLVLKLFKFMRWSMDLPSPSTMGGMWSKVNFLGEYIFTQPLHHMQNVI